MDLTNLTDIEVRVLRRGLKRLRYESSKNVERNERAGWTPEEGRIDISKAVLGTIESLLVRLPFPEPNDSEEPS